MRAFCYLFILFNNFFQYTSTNVGKNLGGGGLAPKPLMSAAYVSCTVSKVMADYWSNFR